MGDVRSPDVQLEGLCGGAVRLTMDFGPDFVMTESISEKLRGTHLVFGEIGSEVAEATGEEVTGFQDLGSLAFTSFRPQQNSTQPFGGPRMISNQYGCHCVAVGQTADNR